MTKVIRFGVLAAILGIAMVGCDKDGDGGKGTKSLPKIEDEPTAKQLARAVRSSLSSVNYAISEGFSAPVNVSGSESGSVSVSGTKSSTSTGTSSSGSGYDTETTDISLVFSDFSDGSNLKIVSGNGTYYRHYSYDYRNWGSVSSSKTSVSYTLTSCLIIFSYNGKKYGCTVDISYRAPEPYARSYNGSVTVEGKETFSFTGYDY